jgi:hypothetical protein
MIVEILWLLSWPVLIGLAYLLVQKALKKFEQDRGKTRAHIND